MPSFDYRRETHSMTLSQFREYYQEEGYPQAFIVEQNQSITGECWLQEGQIAIACHERTVRVLQATVLLEDGRTRPASIPINLKVLFALLPAENSMKFSGHPKLSAKDILHAKDGLPKAVQVLGPCKNSKKQPVPANEVLFNVAKSGKHDFTGTSAAGVRHTFREGDSTAQFSSRLGDVKVYPVKFFDHITFPQKARVYLSEGQDCQVKGLEHLCVVEFTGRHEQHFLAIMPNIDDPENRDCQAVPFDMDIMVSGVTLKGYPMENLTLKDRKMIKQRSTNNVVQPPGNLYVAKPVDPTVRDEPDPAHLCDPAPPDSRRQSQISLGRSQSTFSVNMEIHYYNWPPEGPEGAVSPQTSGRRSIGLRLFPGLSQSEQCLPTCVEDPSEYTYVQLDLSTPVQPRGPPSSSPPPPPLQHAKPQHRMSLPLQPSQVSRRPQQPNTIDEDDSHSSTPPPPPQHAIPKHRRSLPPQSSPVSRRLQLSDTIDEDDSHSSPPPPPPQHAKPKYRRSLPPKSSPVLPHPQQPDTIDEDAYEEMEVPQEDTSLQKQKVQVPVNWKLSQPQPSRPSPPVSPACSDHSTKPKPKGVPSTAIQLVPAVSTPTQHPPPVSKKPIMLNSRPNEPELRFHVAAKIGQDWRSVCSYLGLQNYELDQANMAHTKLEDKAMEALVMWLQGQGKSKAPRSWKTLVEALRWAGHKDMASDLERHIKNKTLEVKL